MLQSKTKWLAYTAAVILGAASFVAQAEKAMKPFILGSAGAGERLQKSLKHVQP